MWRLSSDMMLVAGFDGTIHAVNPAWSALLGWREEELVGHSFFNLVHPDDLASTRAAVGRVSGGPATTRFENRYRNVDGSFVLLSWTSIPEGRLMHGIGRDITAEASSPIRLCGMAAVSSTITSAPT